MIRSIDISALARKNVLALTPYSSARDEFRGKASLYLDANENPFASAYNRYPDAQQQKLREVVGKLKKVGPKQLLLTNGSDEAIDLLMRTFCEPGKDSIIIPQPTYGMYATYAAINNIDVREVPLHINFELNLEAILRTTDSNTKVIFLCSPNNPSGNVLSTERIKTLLNRFNGLVIIDEAYIDFSGTASWTAQLGRFQNLVVLQTFSKAWGLAGLRLGICLANPQIIGLLNKIKPPYNISVFTEHRVIREIQQNQSSVRKRINILKRERERLSKVLSTLSIVKRVHPSDANFLLVEVTNATNAYNALIDRRVVVRNRSNALHCKNCLRITVGTPAQNKKLLNVLASL